MQLSMRQTDCNNLILETTKIDLISEVLMQPNLQIVIA